MSQMTDAPKIGSMIGKLRSPGTDTLVTKSPLKPAIAANTTISRIDTKAAPIQSPMQGQKNVK